MLVFVVFLLRKRAQSSGGRSHLARRAHRDRGRRDIRRVALREETSFAYMICAFPPAILVDVVLLDNKDAFTSFELDLVVMFGGKWVQAPDVLHDNM